MTITISSPVARADSVDRLHSATRLTAISAHATNTFEPTRGVYTGSGGNVTVRPADDPTTTVVLESTAAGIVLPISIVGVTAAAGTGLLALR